ncbi:hypothetical protein ACIPY2_05675 [Paenarthrobacter sp. NPDC089675]|uniref:hypothetical protein n=1 Tax=Paenarthrobacter sp. NPDC089675 TaxID=3364376 RepID=UPI0037F2E4F9
MSFEAMDLPYVDPVAKRREAMTEILASWDLDGAMPDVTGLKVVREYVAGWLDFPLALLKVSERAEQFRSEETHTAE